MNRPVAAALLALAGVGAHAVDVPTLSEPAEPRAYGWRVGDPVTRHLVVELPAGWRLDEASLPRAGGRGHAIELRELRRHGAVDGARIELTLHYQVFVAPAAARSFDLPAVKLQAIGPQRSAELRADAWPLVVSPLVQGEPPARRGLGELQPDRPPPLLETYALRARLATWAALAALLALGLAVLHLGPPWRAARNRPFGRAWRALRSLPPQPAEAQWREACRTLHEALNRVAGEVLFEHGLERFVAARPPFAALQADLARFLALSRAEFFGRPEASARDGAWLRELCRRCRDAERGFAP